MCTLTFFPLNDSYIFTSNRDEHISRSDTLFPVHLEKNGNTVYFPQDPKAGGTWLASNNDQRIAILLNGAFEAHQHEPPYRKSRGIVLLDLFEFNNLSEFNETYDLEGVEPFTIVDFDANQKELVHELRWDGKEKHYRSMPSNKPQIWSSSQLYSKEIREERKRWYTELVHHDVTQEDLQKFHEFGGYANQEKAIKMDWGNGLQTISISQLNLSRENTNFVYHNLLSDKIDQLLIENR